MNTFPIFAKLGGKEAVIAALQATRDQVRMWEARSSIPGDAQRALMEMADKARVKYSAADFRLSKCRERAVG